MNSIQMHMYTLNEQLLFLFWIVPCFLFSISILPHVEILLHRNGCIKFHRKKHLRRSHKQNILLYVYDCSKEQKQMTDILKIIPIRLLQKALIKILSNPLFVFFFSMRIMDIFSKCFTMEPSSSYCLCSSFF